NAASQGNKAQMEALIGVWAFTYDDGAGGFTQKYRMTDVQETPPGSGSYTIFGHQGTSGSGDVTTATYSSTLKKYVLVQTSSLSYLYFVFDFTGTNTVRGCTYS